MHLTHTPHGTHLKGLLDSSTGHQVALALALEAAGQRTADALDTLAEHTLTSADTKPGAHVPPQVSVILTEETWAAAQTERERHRTALTTFGFNPDTHDDGSGTAGGGASGGRALFDSDSQCGGGPAVLPTLGYPPATLEDGTPIPTSELGVVMRDCELTRIVINSDGVPLDLGRTERLFTGPQRKAVIARDRECAWLGCHAHARWCHIHHLTWWHRDNGATSVEDGAMLCNYHHHEVHRLDLTLTRHTLAANHRGTTSITRVRYELTNPTGPPSAPPRPPRPPGLSQPPAPDQLDLGETADSLVA